MIYLRSYLFTLVYAVSGIVWGTLTLTTWLMPALVRHRIIIGWTRFSVQWVRVCCGLNYSVTGLEHVKNINRPVVALAKHQSTWETLFLQGLFFPASTVLKKELLRIPFFGWGLAALRPIAIDRSDPIKALKQVKAQGVENLQKHGLNLILFPEGTRVKVGEHRKYARSGVDIAIKAGADILPIAHNAGVFWPIGSSLKYPGTIQVAIGAPISTEGRPSKAIIAEVEAWIEDQVNKMPKTRDE